MKTVLIVDDSQMSRNFYAGIFLDHGFDVVQAQNGAEALEKLATQPCDLVLTDINMPVMDGLEFIRRLRAEGDFRDIPVLVMSTLDAHIDFLQGKVGGANAFLAKPILPDVLMKTVDNLLKRN